MCGRNFDKSKGDRVVKQRDRVTVIIELPLWVVEVIDADPEARQRTVKVKVAAEYQPVSELKTPKSRRTLVLTPELVSRFRQHRVQQAEAQMAAGPLWQDHGLIFASEVGTPMDPDNSRTPSPGCASGPGSVTGTRTSCATRGPR